MLPVSAWLCVPSSHACLHGVFFVSIELWIKHRKESMDWQRKVKQNKTGVTLVTLVRGKQKGREARREKNATRPLI
jgi:hypothetical protein